jgi:hypothetical protein
MKRSFNAIWRFLARIARLGFGLFVALLVVWGLFYLGFRLLLQAAHESLQSHANPATDYAEAVSRFQKMQENEGPELNPVCRSILLTHGQQTEKAVLFFHGYTNCPQQFRQLGQIFYEMGYMY